MGGALAGLSLAWYKDYPKTNFHFKNDNNDWMQMDKVGHLFSAYHLSRLNAGMLGWAGCDEQSRLIYGAGSGFLFLTAVEVMDGYSAEWGASWGDVVSNAVGSGLFVTQELLWQEQRIIPKFSFHTTSYARLRPELLGDRVVEQILKDYNGQTYWLSVNVRSFLKKSSIPKWINVAAGYGADGLLSGSDNNELWSTPRRRQFYLSLDIDLTRVNTKSSVLRTMFEVVNTIKIPAPTIEFNSSGKLIFHPIYF
jgi:hypothetical protein